MDILSLPYDILKLLFFSSKEGAMAGFILYHVSINLRKVMSAGLRPNWGKQIIGAELQVDCAKNAKWKVVKWLIYNLNIDSREDTVLYAIQYANAEILMLPELNLHEYDGTTLLCKAAKHNRIDMMSCLMTRLNIQGNIKKVCQVISKNNNLELLKWFLRRSNRWYYFGHDNDNNKSKFISNSYNDVDEEILTGVIRGGSLEIFKWAIARMFGANPVSLSNSNYEDAVTHGNLELLKYIIKNKYYIFDTHTASMIAIENDRAHIIEWIHQTNGIHPIHHSDYYQKALKHGSHKVFTKLVDLGYPIPQNILSNFRSFNNYYHDYFPKHGDKIVAYLLSKGFQPNLKLSRLFVDADRLDLLKITSDKSFYRENISKLVSEAMDHFDILKWLVNEFEESVNLSIVFYKAITEMNIKVVEWLIVEKNITTDVDVFRASNMFISFEMMKLLHQYGKMDLKNLLFSVMRNQMESWFVPEVEEYIDQYLKST